MERLRRIVICFLFVLLTSGNSAAQSTDSSWMVVISQESSVTTLTQKQVKSLFLGRSKFLPDETRVFTIDHAVESEQRADFYLALTGKNIADIDAYWARLKYSGRATPPQPVASTEQIIQLLNSKVGTIAYLPISYSEELSANGLKTVLTM